VSVGFDGCTLSLEESALGRQGPKHGTTEDLCHTWGLDPAQSQNRVLRQLFWLVTSALDTGAVAAIVAEALAARRSARSSNTNAAIIRTE
jgi:hypothetical protein